MKQLTNAKRVWKLKRNSLSPFYLRWMAKTFGIPWANQDDWNPQISQQIKKNWKKLTLQHRFYMVLNLSKTDNQDIWNYAVHKRVKNHLLFFLGADPLGAFRHRSTRDLPPIFSLPRTETKYCTLIKRKQNFSSYIGKFRWDRVQSHMRKGFLVYEEMHKYFQYTWGGR